MNAYSELYLNDAKNHMASLFDYAINTCGFDADFFFSLFLKSSVSKGIESGNPSVITGMSGYEWAETIVKECYEEKKLPEPDFNQDRTPEYWAGWILAQYQWHSGRTFKSIACRIRFSEIISMYNLYHEMDVTKFYDRMEEIFSDKTFDTNLKKIREAAGFSQSELSKLSGVNLRNIQMYEQRNNDIDKAQVSTLFKLSKTLGCNIEDLLENPSAA